MNTDKNVTKKTALITGASSGIGVDFARIFAREGYNLVLTARREDRLNKLAEEICGKYDVEVDIIAKDLAYPKAADEVFDELKTKSKHIDVLVNNAGFGDHSEFHNSDPKTMLDMIQVNVTSLTRLTRSFLPAMVNRGYGRILNVSSTGAFQAVPRFAVYAAAKAYVLSFTEAINEELKDTGVTATVLCPGVTESEFAEVANSESTNLVSKSKAMSSAEVAEIGYKAMMNGKPLEIPGVSNKLMAASGRLLPRYIVTRISGSMTAVND